MHQPVYDIVQCDNPRKTVHSAVDEGGLATHRTAHEVAVEQPLGARSPAQHMRTRQHDRMTQQF